MIGFDFVGRVDSVAADPERKRTDVPKLPLQNRSYKRANSNPAHSRRRLPASVTVMADVGTVRCSHMPNDIG